MKKIFSESKNCYFLLESILKVIFKTTTMKYTAAGIILLYVYVLGSINYSLGATAPDNIIKFDDVRQRIRDKTINANQAQKKEERFLIGTDFQDYLKLIDYQTIISLLMNNIFAASPNSSCDRDLKYVKENINFKDIQNSWALKILDAFGKPETGILEGNLKFLGDFDECKSVYAPKKKNSDAGNFHGKYCSLKLSVDLLPMPVTLGICLPDTCNPSDFNISNFMPALKQITKGYKINSLSCKPNSLKLSDGGIVTIFIISAFLLLVLLGSSVTALKHFTEPLSKQNNVNMEGISIDEDTENIKNESSLNSLALPERSPSQLRDFTGSLNNVIPQVDNLPFQAVLNGWYSVDSFFVLSGFLMSYLYFQDCEKRKGKTPWLYFYVHRYLRLTPVYMIVLAFYATVLPVMGSGPFWRDTNVDQNCHKNWWWNLLYINSVQKINYKEHCFALTWYLANDMQFFALSPLFLITLWRWPKIGYATMTLFLCGSWLCGFIITYHYDLLAGTLGDIRHMETDTTYLQRFLEYMDKIYYKPYTRIAPYLIGIALGYVIFKKKITNISLNRATLWTGWLLSITSGLYCVYGTYHQTPNLVGASFYNALTRTVYGLSLSWLIFVCLSGHGGVVDKFLSYKLFIPLSRLTYCAYLIHVILMDLYSSNQRQTLDFNHQTMVMLFLGLLMVTYAFSMLISLTFESPLIRLEKLIRNKFQSRSRTQ
ncbi:nose resistant to fluoxetine protein 6 [Parasteatoda tepidariorum]|uniref:nose resistant to fluoxetine protein 6 n=1 Tax=Parasteatoda tepidariorum TaxID=114398 RepID=UPI0039BC7136